VTASVMPAIADRTCIVVFNINDTSLDLVVDTVKEVSDIPENHIEPPPVFFSGLGKVDDEVKILLDAEKLLKKGDLAKVNSAASAH